MITRRIYQALAGAAMAMSVGVVVFGIAAVLDLHMLPAALVWSAATAAWLVALRDMQARRRDDLTEDEHG